MERLISSTQAKIGFISKKGGSGEENKFRLEGAVNLVLLSLGS